jgi:hypothetical protein
MCVPYCVYVLCVCLISKGPGINHFDRIKGCYAPLDSGGGLCLVTGHSLGGNRLQPGPGGGATTTVSNMFTRPALSSGRSAQPAAGICCFFSGNCTDTTAFNRPFRTHLGPKYPKYTNTLLCVNLFDNHPAILQTFLSDPNWSV